MSHIILKDIDYDKINIKGNSNRYKIYYYDTFIIKGIPLHCKGEIIYDNDNENYKFYIDDKSYDILYNIQSLIKSKLNRFNNFLKKDKKGNHICFTNNYYTKDKLNDSIKELYLNIKYINNNNYNTIIHII